MLLTRSSWTNSSLVDEAVEAFEFWCRPESRPTELDPIFKHDASGLDS